MDCSKRFFFLFSLLILGLISSSSANLGGASKQRPGLVGGYQPISSPKDPYVVEIAKFAVDKHNSNGSDDLVFVKVLSGQQQVVAGMNYDLTIVARHGAHGAGGKYQAVVYDRSWDKYRSLTSFKKL